MGNPPTKKLFSLVMETQLATGLEEYFQCGLCNKPATSPKLLECLHTFCAGCLERESNGSDVTCPICEMVTKKGLSSLPDNIFVSNLQNCVRKQQQILESAEQRCASCGENASAEFVCLECDKVLCNKCLHTHQVLMPDHKKHVETLGTLRKLNSDEFLKILRRSKDLLCSSHENQTISLYCRTCSMWLCVLCALLEHKDHDCTPVRKQINLLKSELQETLAAIVTKQEEFVESQSQLEQLVDDVNRDKYKLVDLIKARVQAALQKVKEEEFRLLNELQVLHSSKTQKLQVSLNSIENVLKRMEVSKNVVSQLLRYATEQEILKLQGTIKSALAELREEKPMDVHVDSTIIDFQECCKFPEKMLGNLMITRLKHVSTLDGKSPLPGCRIAVHCNKEVGESSKCNFNKRKCYAAEESQTSKKLCVKEEPSSCPDDDSTAGPSSHQQSRTPSIECLTVITDSNRQEQVPMFMDTVVIVKEDGAGDAMQRESGAEMPSGGQNGPQQSTEETLVFFDLETTGLENDCDIVQLSAVSGEKIFNKYILPSKPISEGAFAINGFQVLDGVLYLRGEPLQASSLQDTLEAFLHFLQSLASPLIIGHNIWRFDARILLRVLQELSMKDQFDGCITGFLDTFFLAKVVVPRSQVSSYRQNELVKVFLKKGYNAHNAVEDAKSLQELYSVLKFTPEQKKSSQFSFSQLECHMSMRPLLRENIIFSQLAGKLAKQGVTFEKLQSTHQQDGEEGLKNFLRSLGHIEPSCSRVSWFFSK